jgi:hypothetical protein
MKEIAFFKSQYPSGAAGDTFAAGETSAINDRSPGCGMGADIDAEGAVVGTYPALHTSYAIWHNMCGDKRIVSLGIALK